MKRPSLIKLAVLPVIGLCLLFMPSQTDAISTVNYSFAPYGSSLANNMLGWWTFDGKNMIPNVIDSSGNGRNGNLVGQASTTVAGAIGQGMQFNGTAGDVDVPGTTAVADNLPNFTVSIWYKQQTSCTLFGGICLLISKLGAGGLGSGSGWGLAINSFPSGNDHAYAEIQTDGNNWVGWNVTFTTVDNKWHQLVMAVSNANTMALYWDGSTANTNNNSQGTIGSYTNASDIIISSDTNGEFYGGGIDDARIYSRTLTAAEVKQMFLSERAIINSRYGNTVYKSNI